MNKLPPTAAALLAQARAEDRAHRVDLEASLAALSVSLPFADGPLPTSVPPGPTEAALQSASGLGTTHTALFAGKGLKLFLATVAVGGTLGGGAWLGLGPQRPATVKAPHAPASAPLLRANSARAPEAAQPAEAQGTPDVLPTREQAPALVSRAAAPSQVRSSARARAAAPTARAPVTLAAQGKLESASQAAARPAPQTEAPPAEPQQPESPAPALPSEPRELDLIDDALASLRAGAPQAALSKLELHEQLYAQGKFAVERRGLRVLSLCQLGRDEQARRERAAFLTAHAGAPIAARVRKACAAEEER